MASGILRVTRAIKSRVHHLARFTRHLIKMRSVSSAIWLMEYEGSPVRGQEAKHA